MTELVTLSCEILHAPKGSWVRIDSIITKDGYTEEILRVEFLVENDNFQERAENIKTFVVGLIDARMSDLKEIIDKLSCIGVTNPNYALQTTELVHADGSNSWAILLDHSGPQHVDLHSRCKRS